MSHVAIFVRVRKAKGRTGGLEPGDVGTVRILGLFTGSRIKSHLSEAVHLLGLDAAGLAIPDTTHSTIAEPGCPGHARESAFDVLAEPHGAGDQFNEGAGLGLSCGHADTSWLGTSSRELG
ncbi:hypothetical protein ASF59_10865 [Methylobacterium sp. Leaf121]|nr:hypothetical protein ASF59_10865 [Methylobacterium sp. Leaf121]